MVIDPNSSIGVNTIIESHDAVFYENRFTTIPRLESNQEKEFILLPSEKSSEPPSESIEHRRSKRARIAKSFCPVFVVFLVEGTRNSLNRQIMVSSVMESDPLTFEEAMKSNDYSFWKEVVNDEMDSIMGNKTWKLVDQPLESKPIGCKHLIGVFS